MLGDFYAKKRQNWEGSLDLTENWLRRNRIWGALHNQLHVSHILQKDF